MKNTLKCQSIHVCLPNSPPPFLFSFLLHMHAPLGNAECQERKESEVAALLLLSANFVLPSFPSPLFHFRFCLPSHFASTPTPHFARRPILYVKQDKIICALSLYLFFIPYHLSLNPFCSHLLCIISAKNAASASKKHYT